MGMVFVFFAVIVIIAISAIGNKKNYTEDKIEIKK